MNKPLVSIVIPCYNQERFVGAAIESALAQTYSPLEVVVVNDGSTDGSGEILKRFSDRIVLVDQENGGLSAARNAAIRASTGEFIMLLDADDILLPNCVESRLVLLGLSPQARPIGLVAGYYREIDEYGNLLPRIPEVRKLTQQSHFYQAVRRNWGPPVGWLISKRALDRCGGFDPFLKSCEDWDLLIRITTKFDIAYDPNVGAHYRQMPGQMSRNHLTMYDAGAKVLMKNSAYAKSKLGYWWWSQFGRFQHGRRILYNVLSDRKGGLGSLVLRRPALLWIGLLSIFSYLLGKRASG
ncbi:MAG: glycosyltransferase [Fimbriimonadaceae bacterium]